MVLCALPQIGLRVAWALLSKLQRHKHLQYNVGLIFLECTGASPVLVVFVLSYLGILAISYFVIALKGRKVVPSSSEPKLIIFSMHFFFMVSFAFVPAYFSTQGKFSVVTEMFAIIAVVFGFVGCIFSPKLYLVFKSYGNK